MISTCIISQRKAFIHFSFIFTLTFTCSVFAQDKSTLDSKKIAYANFILQTAKEENDSAQIAEAYYLFGKIEEAKMSFQKSTYFFLKSLRVQEKRNDFEKIARLYLRLSEVEYKQNHYIECKMYARRAVEHQLKSINPKELEPFYNHFSKIHQNHWVIPETNEAIMPNLDSALYYLKKTEQIELAQNDEINLGVARQEIGYIYMQLNDKRAIPYLEQAIKIKEKMEEQVPLLNTYLSLSAYHLRNQQNQKALEILQLVDKKIEKGCDTNIEFLTTYEQYYAWYYQNTKNWEKAFIHLKLNSEYLQKNYLQDRNGSVSMLNIAFETQKKETQIIEQKKEIALRNEIVTLQKKILWLVGCLLIFTIIIGYIFYRLYKKNKELSLRNSILLQEQNHRVKNNLQVVSSLLGLQSNQLEEGKAKRAVDESQLRIEAITLLHHQLYDRHEGLDVVNMQDFIIELTETILQTYHLNNVDVEYNITLKQMKTDKIIFIGLIINELISNACKYALKESVNPCLRIVFTQKLNVISLHIKDNGASEVKNTLKTGTSKSSFGIKLINMMVSQLEGTIEYHYAKGSEFIVKFKE